MQVRLGVFLHHVGSERGLSVEFGEVGAWEGAFRVKRRVQGTGQEGVQCRDVRAWGAGWGVLEPSVGVRFQWRAGPAGLGALDVRGPGFNGRRAISPLFTWFWPHPVSPMRWRFLPAPLCPA